ncbi:hypothetical protein IGI04_027287 [Brassica rapa subsp. trilocularis]|uniref:Uncharacterized protein n=1 Tax=Brassica rapa subsp. trilocularis TaxID=1813537 RepID=A0ABQ7L0W1_BRACM|nr:hypothetical protein IGI04_027287 [Brassica rapa subsp. trilocularis]
MSKQQLHFFELRAGRSRNVKKGGDLMGMDLVLLDGKLARMGKGIGTARVSEIKTEKQNEGETS